MRIEIDEDSPAKSVTFGQTLLRGAAGLILVGHGAQKLAQLGVLATALSARLELADADARVVAYALAAIELAAGAGLILGWFTRVSAFVLFASSAAAFATEYARVGAQAGRTSFELAVLLLAAGILFMAAGGGSLSLDRALRERRRRRAIERDPTWSRPPYVASAHHSAE